MHFASKASIDECTTSTRTAGKIAFALHGRLWLSWRPTGDVRASRKNHRTDGEDVKMNRSFNPKKASSRGGRKPLPGAILPVLLGTLLGALLGVGSAMAQQTDACALLKIALTGNALINGKQYQKAPANLAWPVGSTLVGGGDYSVALFDGNPGAADVAKRDKVIAEADKQVAACLPTARRTVDNGMIEKGIIYCPPGSARAITIGTSTGNRMISANLNVGIPRQKICP